MKGLCTWSWVVSVGSHEFFSVFSAAAGDDFQYGTSWYLGEIFKHIIYHTKSLWWGMAHEMTNCNGNYMENDCSKVHIHWIQQKLEQMLFVIWHINEWCLPDMKVSCTYALMLWSLYRVEMWPKQIEPADQWTLVYGALQITELVSNLRRSYWNLSNNAEYMQTFCVSVSIVLVVGS